MDDPRSPTPAPIPPEPASPGAAPRPTETPPPTLGEEFEALTRGLRHAIARERRRGRRRVVAARPAPQPANHGAPTGAPPSGTAAPDAPQTAPAGPPGATHPVHAESATESATSASQGETVTPAPPSPKRVTPSVPESARAAARAARAVLEGESKRPRATSQGTPGSPAGTTTDSGGPGPGEPSPTDPRTPEGIRALASRCPDLDSLAEAVSGCTACALCEGRTQTVFADGLGTRGLAFVGEAPGFHEDQQGVPFVGPAGQLLSDIITKGMGLRREEVFICNVLKCRPPGNRDPLPGEKDLCTPWLDRQLELIGARVVIPLGRHAAGYLLGSQAALGRLRGRVHERNGRKIIPTYHPAYLLRNPSDKKECWKDIQLAMAELGIPRPGSS